MPFPAGAPSGFPCRFEIKYNTDGIPSANLDDYPKFFKTASFVEFSRRMAAVVGSGRPVITEADGETVVPFFDEQYGVTDDGNTFNPTVSSDVFTLVAHGLETGYAVKTITPGYGGLIDGPNMFVIKLTADTYQLAVSLEDALNGDPITGIDDGNPDHDLQIYSGQLIATFAALLTAASVGDVIGYLYAGNNTDLSDEEGCFTPAGFAARYGWNGDAHDSTSNDNDGTLQGGATASDGVLTLDGSGDYVSLAGPPAIDTQDVTILAVGKVTAGSFNYYAIFSSDFSSDPGEFALFVQDEAPGSGLGGGDYSHWARYFNSLTLNQRFTAAVVGNGGNVNLYADGVSGGTTGSSVSNATPTAAAIGARTSGGFGFPGELEELQICTALAAEWIAYFDADQIHNEDTFTLGAWEVDSGGGGGATVTTGRMLLLGVGC